MSLTVFSLQASVKYITIIMFKNSSSLTWYTGVYPCQVVNIVTTISFLDAESITVTIRVTTSAALCWISEWLTATGLIESSTHTRP